MATHYSSEIAVTDAGIEYTAKVLDSHRISLFRAPIQSNLIKPLSRKNSMTSCYSMTSLREAFLRVVATLMLLNKNGKSSKMYSWVPNQLMLALVELCQFKKLFVYQITFIGTIRAFLMHSHKGLFVLFQLPVLPINVEEKLEKY